MVSFTVSKHLVIASGIYSLVFAVGQSIYGIFLLAHIIVLPSFSYEVINNFSWYIVVIDVNFGIGVTQVVLSILHILSTAILLFGLNGKSAFYFIPWVSTHILGYLGVLTILISVIGNFHGYSTAAVTVVIILLAILGVFWLCLLGWVYLFWNQTRKQLRQPLNIRTWQLQQHSPPTSQHWQAEQQVQIQQQQTSPFQPWQAHQQPFSEHHQWQTNQQKQGITKF